MVNYLKNSSLDDFINNINLNEETNTDDTIYLSTIHGAKGLEWKYVYIIDMSSNNFPFIRPKYYLDEFEENEEERRLFYVACSRAKDKLYITYHSFMSPLLREINPSLYTIINIDENPKIKPTLNIYVDVKKHLNIYGYLNVYNELSKIINNKKIVNKKINIPENIIINYKIINSLIFKIIQIKYSNKIKNCSNISSDISWDTIIDNIFTLESCTNIDYKNFLINNILNFEKGICQIINMINPNEIYINYITSYGSVKGNIDILCDNVLIYINSNLDCCNICEKILYTYLLKKNNREITNIIFYNPINGDQNNIDITKINIITFKKIFYKLD